MANLSPTTHTTTADLDKEIDRATKDHGLSAALKSIVRSARVDGFIGSTALTPSVADLNTLAGADAAAPVTTTNVGTAGTGVTAVEYGNGYNHTTVLTLAATVPAIAGGAALAVGNLIYTLPAGACLVESAYMSAAITQADGNINADTPDVGIGTVIASGAVAVLGGTATFENIITGQTAADCNGTATVKTATPTAGTPLAIETGDAHTIHLNVADTWAASGDTGASLTGTVLLNWKFMA